MCLITGFEFSDDTIVSESVSTHNSIS